ncbi:Guanine nucleotide exchange factor VAV3 [Thelohanellus kitauei]|uniref:Guanine nucleotide exchange factor VAV3 n=1 Tax=Thelohanellus kitauei TaxID=669202 RepID=A0A0C2NEB7_THEKT|nr:Guanine nucleotide exchange factor VAV3 [Thelohanellus kitauei]
MTEVWKVVKEFLASSKVDPSVEKIHDIKSLYHAIRNGQILCEILNLIVGEKFCQVNKSKQSTLNQAIANLGQFLSGCKNILEMTDDQLFNPCDLYYGTNLTKVFHTLEDISNLEASTKVHLKRFFCPITNKIIRVDGSEIVFDTNDETNDNDTDHYVYDMPKSGDAEDNYMSADKFISSQKSSEEFSISKSRDKYENSVAEFLENDKKFFMYHLELLGEVRVSYSKIYDYLAEKLSFAEVEILFSNFQNMKNAQNFISQSFTKVKDDIKNRTVAHTFIKYKHYFLEYVPFVSKLSQMQLQADKHWKDPKLRKGITEVVKDFDPKAKIFDLKSMLITPMQHITRYRIQVEAMIKHSSSNPARQEELQKGLEQIKVCSLSIFKDILDVINKCEEDLDESMKISALERR